MTRLGKVKQQARTKLTKEFPGLTIGHLVSITDHLERAYDAGYEDGYMRCGLDAQRGRR